MCNLDGCDAVTCHQVLVLQVLETKLRLARSKSSCTVFDSRVLQLGTAIDLMHIHAIICAVAAAGAARDKSQTRAQ